MIKWTTPTFVCTVEEAEGLEFDYLIFTMCVRSKKIEKYISSSEFKDNTFEVTLTQEETGYLLPSSFNNIIPIEIQVNFIKNNESRFATCIHSICAKRNLHDEVI